MRLVSARRPARRARLGHHPARRTHPHRQHPRPGRRRLPVALARPRRSPSGESLGHGPRSRSSTARTADGRARASRPPSRASSPRPSRARGPCWSPRASRSRPITGTNGKTTTTRLLAHIGMTAGLTTAWSSTDGVVVQGEVRRGGRLLRSGRRPRACSRLPGSQLGILETARGGHAAQGHGGLGQRRQRRHQRLRRPPRACRASTPSTSWPRSRPSSPGSPSRPAGSCSTARTRGSGRCAAGIQGPAVGVQPRPGRTRPARVAQRRRPRRSPCSTATSSCCPRTADPDRLVPVVDVPVTLSGLSRAQHRQRAGGRGRGPRARPAPRRPWSRGCARSPRTRAQPGPDEHLLGAAAARRDGHRHHRPGPQRGRPGGAAGGGRGLRPPGGRRAPRPGHRRRPHRRASSRRSARSPAGAPTRSPRCTRSTTCAGARWRTSRPTCGSAWRGSGSARSTSYPTELERPAGAGRRAPSTATCVARDVPRRAGRCCTTG